MEAKEITIHATELGNHSNTLTLERSGAPNAPMTLKVNGTEDTLTCAGAE